MLQEEDMVGAPLPDEAFDDGLNWEEDSKFFALVFALTSWEQSLHRNMNINEPLEILTLTYVCMCECVYTCMYACMHVCMYV